MNVSQKVREFELSTESGKMNTKMRVFNQGLVLVVKRGILDEKTNDGTSNFYHDCGRIRY